MKQEPSIIGQRLKAERSRLGLTQQELAEATGLQRVNISKLESGTLQSASRATLESLADKLGVSVDYLLGRMEESPIEPMIAEYLSSPFAEIDKPTKDEIEELRRTDRAFWRGRAPTPEILSRVVRLQRKIAGLPRE